MSPDPDARHTLAADALDVLFRKARTHRAWLDRPVPDDLLRRVYELAAEGPTSANCSPMRVYFVGKPELIAATAFRNGSLQGAYLILAARALGLDCGGMSGFDNATVDAAFFPDGRVKSNFLCNLGYGDASKLPPRPPRQPFDEACRFI